MAEWKHYPNVNLQLDKTALGIGILLLIFAVLVKIWSPIGPLLSSLKWKRTFLTNRTSSRESQKMPQKVECDLKSTFPTSRRLYASSICPNLPPAIPQKVETARLENPIPVDQPYCEVDGSQTSPTGFTISEIRQIGDFPDYAALSGIPLPEPLVNFDINYAKARPYRPFRWPYHQTMCKPTLVFQNLII
jgi:hypothetical protein